MRFLQIIFALKQFIVRMAGKPVPVIAYPKQKNSLTDEERVSVQKISNTIELSLQRAALGLPGRTSEEQIDIRQGYYRLTSRSSQYPYRTCPFGPLSLRTNGQERLHIP